jgi:hypothetical protein
MSGLRVYQDLIINCCASGTARRASLPCSPKTLRKSCYENVLLSKRIQVPLTDPSLLCTVKFEGFFSPDTESVLGFG